jgi:hypothetical protein
MIRLSLGLKLMIGLLSVFEVMKLQGNFIEQPYNPSKYKPTWILLVTLFELHVYYIYIYIYIYIKHVYLQLT